MELEPGFVTHDDLPLGPRVFIDGLFESLAEPLAGALGDADPGLASLQLAIAGNVGDGLDASFTTTIGAAEDLNAAQQFGDDLTADALVDAGAGAETYRVSALPFLPQPDAPLESSFLDVPIPGAGHAGGVKGDWDGAPT